jgi:hypothetical protein
MATIDEEKDVLTGERSLSDGQSSVSSVTDAFIGAFRPDITLPNAQAPRGSVGNPSELAASRDWTPPFSSGAAQDIAELPPYDFHNDQARTGVQDDTIICPLCKNFHGDEAAVTYHVQTCTGSTPV